MTFDLGPRSRDQNAIFANISEIMRDRDFISLFDLKETLYGFSVCATAFDLGPMSEGRNAIFANISKILV